MKLLNHVGKSIHHGALRARGQGAIDFPEASFEVSQLARQHLPIFGDNDALECRRQKRERLAVHRRFSLRQRHARPGFSLAGHSTPPLTIRECWCVPKIVPVQIMK